MPKVVCENCGTIHYGWALNYMKCYCDCGNWLNWDMYIPTNIKEVNKVNKIPYFKLKVVKVKKECEHLQIYYKPGMIGYKCHNCEAIVDVNGHKIKKQRKGGNWVNGENLDKIKFPCFCSYTHGSKKVGILSKLGNSFYIINIGGQGDYGKYFLSYDLKHLIEDFNIHILKGKITIFEEDL